MLGMPDLLRLLAVTVIPGILWVLYFHRKDKYEREPGGLVAKTFLVGAVMIIPAGIVESLFRGVLRNPPSLGALLLAAVFGVGLVEEFFKYWAVRRVAYNHPAFNEPVDGIIYAVSAGLGFAAFENVLYASTLGLGVGLVRAVMTSLVHASFSGIVGFGMGIAKFAPRGMEGAVIARSLMLAAVLHGVYDFLLMSQLMNFYLTVLVVLLLHSVLLSRIRFALRLSPFGNPDDVGVDIRRENADDE